jgi:hypothetical protein
MLAAPEDSGFKLMDDPEAEAGCPKLTEAAELYVVCASSEPQAARITVRALDFMYLQEVERGST